ncbi:hypothetical protein C8R45DRAFT_938128 [Mycena sanguinolenta]|nr:hypothetical protein C8R45DRAFT_938128 [Mycena sanguinolenta]
MTALSVTSSMRSAQISNAQLRSSSIAGKPSTRAFALTLMPIVFVGNIAIGPSTAGYITAYAVACPKNEETLCVKIVHFSDQEDGVPSEPETNVKNRSFREIGPLRRRLDSARHCFTPKHVKPWAILTSTSPLVDDLPSCLTRLAYAQTMHYVPGGELRAVTGLRGISRDNEKKHMA